MNILSPSILAADFCELGKQIKEAGDAGAEYLQDRKSTRLNSSHA